MRLALPPIVLAAALAAGAAQAQDRNANIYDGTAHEPSASGVRAAERGAGVEPPAQVQRREDDEVEQLGRTVLRQSGQTMPKDPPRPTGEPGR